MTPDSPADGLPMLGREHAASIFFVEAWTLAASTHVSEENCLYCQMEMADASKIIGTNLWNYHTP
jgi:hypothetical protein